MNPAPIQAPFDEDGKPSKAWLDWSFEISRQAKNHNTETTANRPTNGLGDGDWMLDSTLGKPIYYYNGGWIDAVGNSV